MVTVIGVGLVLLLKRSQGTSKVAGNEKPIILYCGYEY
jgi:hypothetical protein